MASITVKIPTVPTRSDSDTIASYNVYSNQPSAGTLIGTMTPAEAAAGKAMTFSDGVVHSVTTKAVWTTAGESTISTVPVNIDTSGSSIINVFPTGNAASPGTDEANSVGTWTNDGDPTLATVEASTDQSHDGSYSIKITALGLSGRGSILVPVVNGTVYDISIWVYQVVSVSSGAKFRSWTGFTTSPDVVLNSVGTWTEYTFTLTASITGNALIRCYARDSGGSNGDILYVDDVTVVAQ